MMALKHDAQGFLSGDPIDIGVALKTWDAIQKDVQAIRKAVTTAAATMTAGTNGKSGRERTAPVVALPAGRRGGNANALARRTQTPSGNSLHAASAVRQDSRTATKAIAVPAGRDGRGRFVGGNTSIGGGLHDRDSSTGDSAIRGFADRVVGAMNGAGAGMEEADPAVKASAKRNDRPTQSIPARRGGDDIPALLRKAVIPARNQQEGGAKTAAATGSAEAINRPARKIQAAVKPSGRDNRGRFIKGGGAALDGPAPGEAKDGSEESALRSMTDRIVSAVGGAGAGMEEADPAVKAFNEVAQPVARGYEMVTGRNKEKGQEGWLRRIYSSLTGFSKEETAYSKAANKSLKKLEDKPASEGGGNNGGGLLGAMSGLLSKIPLIGPMLAGGGGAGMMAGAGKGLMGAGKGMLRRIPLLGALLGGVGAASDIYSSETDDSLTRRQKDEKAGTAVGGFAGSVGGMLAGAKLGAMAGAIGGPIGVAIGGVLGGAVGMFFGDQAGQIIGDTVGGWVSDLREADIPGKIVGAWESTTAAIKSGWDSVTSAAGAAWDSAKKAAGNVVEKAKDVGNRANEAVKTATGVDVKATAVAVKDKAVEVGSKAAEKVQQGAEYVANNTTVGKGIKATGEAVKYGTDVAVDVAKSAKARITGKASENRDALANQMAASGITDPKEQAMFMAQMDHESGGFTKMEERFNYRSADRLMAVSGSARKLGKPAVESAMAQGPEAVAEAMYGGRMGNVNPGDAYAFRGRGHVQLTGRDNYTAAGKELGLDLANNPDLAAEPENAAKIAAWYWKKNPKLAVAARNGDVEGATQFINGGQNGIAHRKDLFAQYSADANKGSLATSQGSQGGVQEVAAIAPKAPMSFAAPAAPVVASISSPPVSVAPTAPKVAEAPPVVDTLASSAGGGRKSPAITVAAQEVGQDIKDRRIAHIVTGGLSA